MTLSQDILAELAEIAPDSALAAARAAREAATRHAQGSYETLFGQQDNDFPLDERFAVAARVASCMTAMRWRPTMPVLVLPTPHPRGWPRRWPLPDC